MAQGLAAAIVRLGGAGVNGAASAATTLAATVL